MNAGLMAGGDGMKVIPYYNICKEKENMLVQSMILSKTDFICDLWDRGDSGN